MRRFVLGVCIVLLALAGTALAADITGKWTGETAGQDGQTMTLNYTFKQDGAKLTGSVQGPMGEPLEIKDGKVEGEKLTFTITFEGGNGAMKISNEGTVSAEQIALTSKFEGGDFPPMKITLKKAK